MRPTHCPKCRQVTTPDDAGRCLLCGFDLAEAHRRTLSLYIVTVGVTLSTLVLGGIVLGTRAQKQERFHMASLNCGLPARNSSTIERAPEMSMCCT